MNWKNIFNIIIYLSLFVIFGACSYDKKNQVLKSEKTLVKKKTELDARDIDSLIIEGEKQGKPVLLFFTARSAAVCIKMEKEVLQTSEIVKRLDNDFIFAPLYCDSKTNLKKKEYFQSKLNQQQVKTIGALNSEYEFIEFNKLEIPTFIGLDGSNNVLTLTSYQETNTKEQFNLFLDTVLIKFNND